MHAIAAEAVNLGRAYGYRIVVEWTLQSLAIGLVAQGDARGAATILGHVDGFVDEVGAEREPTEVTVRRSLLKRIDEKLDPAIRDAAMDRGRELSMDEACALALQTPSIR